MHPFARLHRYWRNANGIAKSALEIVFGLLILCPLGFVSTLLFNSGAPWWVSAFPLLYPGYYGWRFLFEALPNITPEHVGTEAGSARWAKWADIKPHVAGTNKKRGVFLSWCGRYMVRYFGMAHVLIFGGTRKGKTSGLLITLLIDLMDECVVYFDPRGEITAILQDLLREHGHLIVLNPRNLLVHVREHMVSMAWNPLALMPSDENDPLFLKMALQIARNAIRGVSTDDPTAKFFNQGSVEVLAAVIMWVKKGMGPNATMAHVRDLIASPTGKTKSGDVVGLVKTLTDIANSNLRKAASKASPYTISNVTTSGVHATVVADTGCFDDDDIRRVTTGPGWDWACLKHGRDDGTGLKPYKVAIICEPDEMEDFAPWLRMVFGAIINDNMHPGAGRYRPRIIFEEVGLMGTFEALVRLMTTGAGYGMQGIVVCHDYNELRYNYGLRAASFTSGCDAKVTLGIGDPETQELWSEQCGDKSFAMRSTSTNLATGEKANMGESVTIQAHRLIKKDEFRRLAHRETVVLIENKHPFKGYAHLYTNTPVPDFDDGCLSNPCHDQAEDDEWHANPQDFQVPTWTQALPGYTRTVTMYAVKLLPVEVKKLPAPRR